MTKINRYKYFVNLNVKSPGDGVIVLDQGYNDGWIATVSCTDEAKFTDIFSLFGDKLRHVRVSGWANGWYIDDTQNYGCKPSSNGLNAVIVYWPQYLQMAGYICMTLSLSAFAVIGLKYKLKRYWTKMRLG